MLFCWDWLLLHVQREEDNGGVNETPRSVVITTRQINYEGSGQAIEDENTITDMKRAFLRRER